MKKLLSVFFLASLLSGPAYAGHHEHDAADNDDEIIVEADTDEDAGLYGDDEHHHDHDHEHDDEEE